MAHVTSFTFPSGSKVGLFQGLRVARPGRGDEPDESKTVGDDGLVSFEVKDLGPVWLAADVGGEWLTTQALPKTEKTPDRRDLLARTRPNLSEQPAVTGARSTLDRPRRRS